VAGDQPDNVSNNTNTTTANNKVLSRKRSVFGSQTVDEEGASFVCKLYSLTNQTIIILQFKNN